MARLFPLLLAVGILLGDGLPAQAGPCLLGSTVKWSQCPDFERGFDVLSNVHVPALVADDFRSDGRPIRDVHWWGSYENDQRIPPLAFDIRFWSDKPGADPSQPADLLKSYLIPFADAREHLDRRQLRTGALGFQYFTLLPEPFFEERDVIYWISIQALSSPTWGWKTSFEHFRDDALQVGPRPGQICIAIFPPPPECQLRELRDPETGQTVDMAFQLTVPAPSSLGLLAAALVGFATLGVHGPSLLHLPRSISLTKSPKCRPQIGSDVSTPFHREDS